MKTRLNLTIEHSLLEKVKSYASAKRIADIIEELPKPTLPIKDDSNKADLKTQYMEENAGKYGFLHHPGSFNYSHKTSE